MSISVILPAARLQEQAQQIVDRLWQNERVKNVVMVSPNFEVKGAYCIHDRNLGSSRVLAEAYKITWPKAEYVAWLSEICLPEPGALDKMLDTLECRNFILKPSWSPLIAEFRTSPPVTPGHYRVCTILGKQYARWGMVSRKALEAIGGFFDEAYLAHYGDVDLSLRCWKAGGYVATCTDAVIEMHGHWHVSTAPASQDEATFIAKWSKDYPEIRADNTAQWNVDMEIPLIRSSAFKEEIS
jgi:hypothetical protein